MEIINFPGSEPSLRLVWAPNQPNRQNTGVFCGYVCNCREDSVWGGREWETFRRAKCGGLDASSCGTTCWDEVVPFFMPAPRPQEVKGGNTTSINRADKPRAAQRGCHFIQRPARGATGPLAPLAGHQMLARLLRGLHPAGPLVLLLHAPRNQAADRLRLCPAPLVVHGGQPLLERLEAAQRVALNRRALAEQRPREDGLLRAEVALRLRPVPAPLRDQRPVRQLGSAEDHVARLVVPLPLLWRRRALQPVVPRRPPRELPRPGTLAIPACPSGLVTEVLN